MLKTKAILRRKDDYFEPKDCVIEKVIRLNSDDFQHYCGNIYAYQDFIKENSDICGKDDDGNERCFLVLDRNGSDGILIQSDGYDYARRTAYVPGAKYFVEACQEMQSMKFYCPLTAETYEEMDEEERQYAEEGDHVDPEAYEDYIRDKIVEYNRLDDERGLAAYLDKELQDKVWSVTPDVEMRGDTLYGVFNIETTEKLSPQELEKLRDFCSGQASDGWGEGFEQREIDTPDGDIYVHFWDSNDNYFMLTEQEFEARMNGQVQTDEPCELSVGQLFEIKMERNYNDFVSAWRGLPPDELIEHADEIAVTKDVWHSVRDGVWDLDYCEYLMRFENPLEVVRDYCLEQQVRKGESIDVGSAGWNLLNNKELENNYALDENYLPSDQSQGIKM